MGLFGLPLYAMASNNFDPATLSLTAWLRNYAGDPWNGTASAGTSGSGSNDFTDAVNAPATGTALNGYGTANFNVVNTLNGDGTLDTYAAASALSGWVLVYPDAISGSVFNAADIAVLDLSGSTAVFSLETGSATVSRTISSGAYSLVTFRYDGSNAQVGVNEAPGTAGGGSTTAYATPLSDLSGTVIMGSNLDGRIAEFGLSDTALTNQNFTDIKSYINRRYGLSL